MTIAEEIYQQVQAFPEDMAREVLDFIDYLKKRHGLLHDCARYAQARQTSTPPGQESVEEEVWSDLLFGPSRFEAVSLHSADRSQESKTGQ